MNYKISKIKSFFIKVIIITLFVIPTFALAQYGLDSTAKEAFGSDAFSSMSSTTLTSTIANLIQVVLSFLGVIFLILIIYGGLIWMTAGGEQDKIGKARKILGNAVIGLAIVLMAYSITFFVIKALTKAVTT